MLVDRYLSVHITYYITEMRIKAYSQLLESYRSLSLPHMALTFGVSEAFIDRSVEPLFTAALSYHTTHLQGALQVHLFWQTALPHRQGGGGGGDQQT